MNRFQGEEAEDARAPGTPRPRVVARAGSRPVAVVFCARYAMREYVIEREIPGAGTLSEEQIKDISIRSLEVLKGIGPQIQWLHSYVTDDRIYCVYLAADEESIREHAQRLGVPATRISAVRRMIDPVKYA